MKRALLFVLLVAFVLVASPVFAQHKYPLGFGNVAVKVDYFRFTDSEMNDLDLDNGIYVGGEGYVSLIHPNLYFGVEAGWAITSGNIDVAGFNVDLDAYYIPIEFNIKYVFEISPCFTIDAGAGGAANYFDIDVDVGGFSRDDDDWIWGGQVFTNVNYKVNQFFLGANLKYQYTDTIDIPFFTDVRASNFRAGVQVGYMF
jgi:hypothetical protein